MTKKRPVSRQKRAARAQRSDVTRQRARRSGARGKRRHGGVPLVATQAQVESLRKELERATSRTGPSRWNASPEDVQRSVMQLVLTLVEFIRRLLERQAIRRLEGHTLTKKETENVGLALMRLEETIQGLAAQFGIELEELNLDLGPVGKLM
jgi:hypothetical protein